MKSIARLEEQLSIAEDYSRELEEKIAALESELADAYAASDAYKHQFKEWQHINTEFMG